MDARTPLLPVTYVKQDHPIFLRACHSPWSLLNQNVLCYIRGFLVCCLLALFGMLADFSFEKEDDDHTNWRVIFQFSTIAFLLTLAYHVLVFAWTFTHFYYPDIHDDDPSIEAKIFRFLQPPEQTPHSHKRFYFSLFYTAVHVASFMNTLIYWVVMIPSGYGDLPHHPDEDAGKHPIDDIFIEGWFKPFCLWNLYMTPTLIGIGEILFLNSIKRQVPVPSHMFGTIFLAGAYLGWAAIGKLLTGHNAFFFLDPEIVGRREVVAAYCSTFVALAPGMFSFMYGLIGMRENLGQRAHDILEEVQQAHEQYHHEHPEQ